MATNFHKKQVINLRLDQIFIAGIEMIKERKSEASGDFLSPTRTDIVREALSLLFQTYDISREDIDERLHEAIKAQKQS